MCRQHGVIPDKRMAESLVGAIMDVHMRQIRAADIVDWRALHVVAVVLEADGKCDRRRVRQRGDQRQHEARGLNARRAGAERGWIDGREAEIASWHSGVLVDGHAKETRFPAERRLSIENITAGRGLISEDK